MCGDGHDQAEAEQSQAEQESSQDAKQGPYSDGAGCWCFVVEERHGMGWHLRVSKEWSAVRTLQNQFCPAAVVAGFRNALHARLESPSNRSMRCFWTRLSTPEASDSSQRSSIPNWWKVPM